METSRLCFFIHSVISLINLFSSDERPQLEVYEIVESELVAVDERIIFLKKRLNF
jgi:hypothetical protein